MLDRLIALLESDGATHWANWMKDCRSRLLNSDYSGIEHLLGAYGGMGSFNDLTLGQIPQDGRPALKPEYEQLNQELESLRSEAGQLADQIKANHEIDGN